MLGLRFSSPSSTRKVGSEVVRDSLVTCVSADSPAVPAVTCYAKAFELGQIEVEDVQYNIEEALEAVMNGGDTATAARILQLYKQCQPIAPNMPKLEAALTEMLPADPGS